MPLALPNIVLITCHDLGRTLGCYDVPTVQTPNIDRLAAEGVQFNQAFCAAPQCSPSRAALFTGRYPHSNGVMGLTHSNFAWDLHPGEHHLGQLLGELGYARTLVGVHHETRTAAPEVVAARCGMDEVVAGGPGAQMTDSALDRLRRMALQGRPFYLQVGYHEPHRARSPNETDSMGFLGGYIAPDEALGVTVPPYLRDTPGGRTEVAELQGAVRYLDEQVGRLLAGVAALPNADNTLVVFTTDHGVALPRAKCSLYDPGLEVALVVRLPSRGWRGGWQYDPLVSHVDLLPTLLELVGLPVGDHIQGRSLLAALEGGRHTPRDHIFGEMTYHDYYDPRRCIRTEGHKLIVNFSAAPAFMNPSQSWRPRSDPLVPERPAEAYHPLIELYDLASDPWERRNLADEQDHMETRRDLLARLYSWMRDTGDPLLEGAVTSPMQRWATAALNEANQ